MNVEDILKASSDQLGQWFGELTPEEERLVRNVAIACVGQKQVISNNHLYNLPSKAHYIEKSFGELEELSGHSLEYAKEQAPKDVKCEFGFARMFMIDSILKNLRS